MSPDQIHIKPHPLPRFISTLTLCPSPQVLLLTTHTHRSTHCPHTQVLLPPRLPAPQWCQPQGARRDKLRGGRGQREWQEHLTSASLQVLRSRGRPGEQRIKGGSPSEGGFLRSGWGQIIRIPCFHKGPRGRYRRQDTHRLQPQGGHRQGPAGVESVWGVIELTEGMSKGHRLHWFIQSLQKP